MQALQAINDWQVAAWLRASPIAYPLLSAAHIASIGLLLGAIVTLDLRLLGAFRGHPLAHLGPPLRRMAAVGLGLAATTGLLLFTTRPVTYAENPAFLAKLGLIALGVLNVAALHGTGRWRRALDEARAQPSVRLSAAISLLAWVAAVVAGRWIGFLQ